jgi:hypothetical protein
MDLQAPSEELMVKVGVAHLVDRLPTVERSRIESTIRRVVHDWYSHARVKIFVGIIAERHARTELQRPQAEVTTHD